MLAGEDSKEMCQGFERLSQGAADCSAEERPIFILSWKAQFPRRKLLQCQEGYIESYETQMS